MKFKISIIIAVLESYDIVRRQMIWYNSFLPKYPEVEFILVDDGSGYKEGSLPGAGPIPFPDPMVSFPLTFIRTQEKRMWTQPCARNLGAVKARGERFLMTDIDHFFTEDCIREALLFTGDKLIFPRIWGTLDILGSLDITEETLKLYAPRMDRDRRPGHHPNTFLMRRELWERLGGYDPKFCGQYGGDDTDLNDRYAKLHYAGQAERSAMSAAKMYVYPDPKWDRQRVFHHLRWGN